MAFGCISAPLSFAERKPDPTPHRASMFVVEEYRGPRHRREAYKGCPQGRTTVRHCFDEVLSSFEPEPNRSLICFSARIALHVQVHPFHYRSKCGTKPSCQCGQEAAGSRACCLLAVLKRWSEERETRCGRTGHSGFMIKKRGGHGEPSFDASTRSPHPRCRRGQTKRIRTT